MYKKIGIIFLLFSNIFASNTWDELDGLYFVENEYIVMFSEDISPLLGSEQPLGLSNNPDIKR